MVRYGIRRVGREKARNPFFSGVFFEFVSCLAGFVGFSGFSCSGPLPAVPVSGKTFGSHYGSQQQRVGGRLLFCFRGLVRR